MYKSLLRLIGQKQKLMEDQNAVASLHSLKKRNKHLWRKAIKWPLYSVAVMPIVLASCWKIGMQQNIHFGQLIGFLIASVLLLIWENLTNDLFDAETGVDQFKFHSIVALTGQKALIKNLANLSLSIGLSLMLYLALRSHLSVIVLVIGCCALGYLYQGPPFRLGYKGIGEPLCWVAFGPLGTAAALMVLSEPENALTRIPWETATLLGAGPALATTLVLFCSHFHQVNDDKQHGKKTLLVRLGTKKAAKLVPWIIGMCFLLELTPVVFGFLPPTTIFCLAGLPSAFSLIRLLKKNYNHPKLISESKFLALRFQTLNTLGMSIGIAISPILGLNVIESF